MAQREQLASRLGFLFLSAGCAIGLGNVWRFPFITGKYGGAVFLVAYLVFLLGMGLPILIMEFTVGRASRRNMSRAFSELTPGSKWKYFGCFSIIGSYALMMFYIPVAGWMMYYCWATITTGMCIHLSTARCSGVKMLARKITPSTPLWRRASRYSTSRSGRLAVLANSIR